MTELLLDQDFPDPVALVLAWLLPMAPNPSHLGMIRHESDPLPYWQVGLIHGVDDPMTGDADATVSVHYMTGPANGVDADTLAIRGGKLTHRRMMLLGRNPQTTITVGGNAANVDFLETIEAPAWRDYQDTSISRVKAVYRLGLSYVAV